MFASTTYLELMSPTNNIMIYTNVSYPWRRFYVRAYTESGTLPNQFALTFRVIDCKLQRVNIYNPDIHVDIAFKANSTDLYCK